MLESIFVKESFQPAVSPPPKAFPLGGRWAGEAGSDEGAIDWPNGAGEGRHRGDRSLLLQGKVGYRIAPSSVTFGDSFPPRGSLWVVQPYPKKRPKSGHVHGFRNSPSTGTLRPTTPKPASENERALKKGVQGATPPALFPPAFSGESRAPARSRAGTHVAGANLRKSQKGPPASGQGPRPHLGSLRLGGAG